MKLSDQYRYNDFTEKNYRYILEQLLKEYEFSKYDYEKIFSDKKIVLLRHDLDTSLLRAVRLAESRKNTRYSRHILYICRVPVITFLKQVNTRPSWILWIKDMK